ncbi:MAG TPA: response regulator transcription factor [Parapedobacter sp.]|uniref:response regulator transcription factor n=1 Tax=Parapedobacter sp. TaxID=1958893 RepID=UPI002CE118F5|nr:response regulator transcription factor [Parapedobacter sp.]HWK57300.1 response regulator transcription factor [Parapedobacter sp.]
MLTNTSPTIHVAIVDDHVSTTEYTADYLRQHAERIHVVFTASDSSEMQHRLKTCDPLPDVVIMDVIMPDMDGYAATEWLAKHHPSIHVLVYTAVNNIETAKSFLRLGVRAFVNKSCSSQELIDAICELADTGKYLNEYISPSLIRSAKFGWIEPGLETVTPRQLEILKQLATGHTDEEIAVALKISITTVRDHLSRMRERFEARDRTHLVAKAYANGVLS